MFLKISEFKKAMKSGLKFSKGLTVGNRDGHEVGAEICWRVDCWK